MSMLDQLQDMGFSRDIAEKALRETGEAGLEEALEWIETHQKNFNTNMKKSEVQPAVAQGNSIVEFVEEEKSPKPSSIEAPQAMSFKCDVCGKHLADDQAVVFHAARAKHDAFSESTEAVKPLTEEEKKERLAVLQKKLKEARAKREEQERKEALDKEKRRRLEGKSMAKQEEEKRELEMKKMVEAKRREKQEEAEARKRVLEQIRLDKEARKAAAQPTQPQPQPILHSAPAANVASASSADFCQLQVRLPDGSVIKNKFKSNEPLSHVRLWVELDGKNALEGMPFTLMTPFPRKIFTGEDMEVPVKALGLVPSASMVAKRAAQ